MFAFVVFPRDTPTQGQVFFHAKRYISDFDPEYLEREIVQRMFSMDHAIEDMEFLEVGKYEPITFEKTVSYTLYKD
jgi:hypothetical protein